MAAPIGGDRRSWSNCFLKNGGLLGFSEEMKKSPASGSRTDIPRFHSFLRKKLAGRERSAAFRAAEGFPQDGFSGGFYKAMDDRMIFWGGFYRMIFFILPLLFVFQARFSGKQLIPD